VRQALCRDIDAIFHVAGNTSHWAAEAEIQWKDNVLATRNLVQVALEKKVKRFIFTSTGATLPLKSTDETAANKVKNGYIRTKRLSELEVLKGVERGLDAVILQPIIVIGAYDYNSYAQIFLNMQNSPLRVCFPGKIAFCHAGDVARAHIQAFEKGKKGENYVLGGTYTTWKDTFNRICAILGVGAPIVLPKWLLMIVSTFMAGGAWLTRKKPLLTPQLISLLKDAEDVPDDEKRKAAVDLGYRSRSLDVMIRDCYLWLVGEGTIKAGPHLETLLAQASQSLGAPKKAAREASLDLEGAKPETPTKLI
jgi:nucleoside-diphosphate-sugar epimerase